MKKAAIVYGTAFLIVLFLFAFQQKKEQVTIASGAATDCANKTGLAKVVCLAEMFKASLKEDQLALVQLAYSKNNAVRWSNFPQQFSHPNRVGIALGALDATQLAAAKNLMASVLALNAANEGYDEMEGIMAADDFFGKTTGQTSTFGAGNYYIALLGTPSTTGLWELQMGGHHFAFANTYNQGKIAGVTPSFRGVEPMAVINAAGNKTYQPIEQERAAFNTIITMLNPAEKDSAKLSATFSDLLLGPGQDGKFPIVKQGLKIGNLSSAQQKEIMKAITLYVDDLDAATAKQMMAKYNADLANTFLSFSGSGTMKQVNDYVRIDGPDIWIEYTVQPSRDFPGTTHPHSVWRDRKTDYGGN